MSEPLIEVKDLKVQFNVRDGIIHAVDGATFTINRGQTLGIIGESGCGKSVTAKAILRMVPRPGKVTGGEILYHRRIKSNGSEITDIVNITELDPDGEEIRKIRGGEIGMIFQEPMSSLTPVYTAGSHIGEAVGLHRLVPIRKVGAQMVETIQAHRRISKQEAREIAIDMLRRVGIPKPEQRVDAYPHQLSGGQRQRVMIAIALSCEPKMLIADEPTTALDVSIEAQILDIMRELQETVDMAIMFITHNLGVVAEMAEEICVMYMGKIVERASAVEIFYEPQHPYTRALLKSIPHVGKKSRERLASIKGMVPDPFNLPSGCVFHPRCPEYMPGKCDRIVPSWTQVGENHWARCLLYEGV
ncbi:MAG: ABC transporter ATP-binding protein [Chloroflexi bacterium]|nr:MAG: ABC transporter ATP-binding protein [Chloroflexota bacterium]RLC89837.1 MAG: ABC transporter ATP-binding protein [Chloroflexota bacterium]HEY67447.1 ABC transporter ATP-binding protein [Thermoflexia bacterium]